MAAGAVVKVEGKENDLVDRIAADASFGLTKEEILSHMKPENFVGRAPKQVEEFVRNEVKPIIERYKEDLGISVEINV
jgi:adenylosuccinate lyase